MGNLNHDACTIAGIADFGTSMAHVLQYMEGFLYQFMALVAVDVDNHAYSTCIMLVVRLVEALLLIFKFSICHIFDDLSSILLYFGCKGIAKC